ncbi:DUF4250 domain-containing protein [Marinomonas sp. 2405UD66-6]|uniref:DUF4250 domain-containing protein n=1 Tax=Marinomonas sp. 2405UD66-6 TaxID=3391834 RepID=UPI0039C8CFB2
MLSKNNLETMDVNILLSVVNMKLRNDFGSLESLCSSFEVDKGQLVARLKKEGYVYDEEHKHFYHPEK